MTHLRLISPNFIPCIAAIVTVRTLLHTALITALLSISLSDVTAASLDSNLRDTAGRLAMNTPWVQSQRSEAQSHPLGVQTLSIEKLESKQSPATRLLNVYQFHYDLQKARLVVVHPDKQQVLSTQSIDSVHLPLSDTEIAYATAMLTAQTTVINRLRAEQIKRGRVPFNKLTELDVKASIYEPLDIQHICHRQRCALLSLFDSTRTVFSTEAVVNLQNQNVLLLDTQ